MVGSVVAQSDWGEDFPSYACAVVLGAGAGEVKGIRMVRRPVLRIVAASAGQRIEGNYYVC